MAAGGHIVRYTALSPAKRVEWAEAGEALVALQASVAQCAPQATLPNDTTPGPHCRVEYRVAALSADSVLVMYTCVGEVTQAAAVTVPLAAAAGRAWWSDGTVKDLLRGDAARIGSILSKGYGQAAVTKQRRFLNFAPAGHSGGAPPTTVLAFSMNHFGAVMKFAALPGDRADPGAFEFESHVLVDAAAVAAAAQPPRPRTPPGDGGREFRGMTFMFHASSGGDGQQ